MSAEALFLGLKDVTQIYKSLKKVTLSTGFELIHLFSKLRVL